MGIIILAIILAIQDEETRSFVEQVYDNYSKQMYVIANDIVHNHYDAEDVVHDVIVRIIDKIEYFRVTNDEQELKKLIVIATRNIAINKYNSNKRRDKTFISTTQVNQEGVRYEKESLDDIYSDDFEISEENIKLLRDAIDKLDPKYRDVFVLMSQGYSNKEISEIMNISVDNVRQRFCRGKAKIIEQGGCKFYDN